MRRLVILLGWLEFTAMPDASFSSLRAGPRPRRGQSLYSSRELPSPSDPVGTTPEIAQVCEILLDVL